MGRVKTDSHISTYYTSKVNNKPETYLGPCQISMMELFAKIVIGFWHYRRSTYLCSIKIK